MEKVCISIIIPAFNAERFIGETLQSILAQTFTDWEAIVVDDGSTDRTAEIIKFYEDKRIKYVYQKNSTQAVARNKGMELAKGEYFAFLDADDLWNPNKLAYQIPKFDNPKVGIVCCGMQYISENGTLLPIIVHPQQRGDVFKECLVENNVVGGASGAVVRATIIRDHKLKFKLNRQGCEDWDMWLHVLLHCHLDYVDETLTYYRQVAGSTSHNFDLMYHSHMVVYEEIIKELSNIDIIDSDLLKQYIRICEHAKFHRALIAGHEYLARGQRKISTQCFQYAMRLNPINIRSYWGVLKGIIKSTSGK